MRFLKHAPESQTFLSCDNRHMAFPWDLEPQLPARTSLRRDDLRRSGVASDPDLEFYFRSDDSGAGGKPADDEHRPTARHRRRDNEDSGELGCTHSAAVPGGVSSSDGRPALAPSRRANARAAVGVSDVCSGGGGDGMSLVSGWGAASGRPVRPQRKAAVGGAAFPAWADAAEPEPELGPELASAAVGGGRAAAGGLTAARLRTMIPEEMRHQCRLRGLPAAGSVPQMRAQLMALLPARRSGGGSAQRQRRRPDRPGYRPSRQHLAMADANHRSGGGGGGDSGGAAAVRLARPLRIAQLALTDLRRGASTTLDFLRGGKLAVRGGWVTLRRGGRAGWNGAVSSPRRWR
jgi:hypothetical protein